MTKKLLLCSALVASLSYANAQDINTNYVVLQNGQATPIEQPTLGYELGENETFISYCKGNDKIVGVGIGKGHYQAASEFPKETMTGLKGNKIKAIRVALNSIDYLEECSIWIKKDLDADPVYSQMVQFTVPLGWNDFELDVPYELDGEKIYLGYSFNLPPEPFQEPQDMLLFGHPLGTSQSAPQPGSLYMNFDHYRWDDYSQEKTAQGDRMGCLMIQAVAVGSQSTQNDVAFTTLENQIVVKNETFPFECTFVNRAQNPVKTLDVTYSLGDITKTQTVTLKPECTMFETATFALDVTVPDICGKENLTVTIDKVNGVEDTNPKDNTQSQQIEICSKRAEHKVVLESGMNAGHEFCIYGEIGLERLDKDCPEKVICIAVHTSDNYAAGSYSALFDQIEKPLPYGMMNRSLPCNPYYGIDVNGENINYGIRSLVDDKTKEITIADIKVSAPFADESKTSVNATAEVTFYVNEKDANRYRVAYVLLEDGLVGAQTNVFNGREGLSEDFAPYANKPATIEDFHFNDVARDIIDFGGIAGSMEGEIVADQMKQHTQNINLSTAEVIANTRLVAMLIDTKTNTIMNANVVKVGDGVGIENTAEDAFVANVTVKDGMLNVASDSQKELTVKVYATTGELMASQAFENNTSIALNGLKGVFIVRVADGNNVSIQKVIL